MGELKKPRLPQMGGSKMLGEGEPASPATTETADEIIAEYAAKGSHVIGLSDATGSMAHVWSTARRQIKGIVQRLSGLGDFHMRWVAYRDYSEGNEILEASGWHDEAEPLLSFIDTIRCFGGDDFEEAVERALEFAVKDSRATRVFLIGDAPPHPEKDYRDQAMCLAQLQRPVFSFVVGGHATTLKVFEEISELTGGLCQPLHDVEELGDLVALTVAEDMGSGMAIEHYLEKHGRQLGEGSRRFAHRLLTSGK